MQGEKQRKPWFYLLLLLLLLLFLCHLFGQGLDKLPLDLMSLCIKTSKQHDSAGSSTQ